MNLFRTDVLQYGAQGETRTLKIWLLRPTRIPIPSPGHKTIVTGYLLPVNLYLNNLVGRL